MLKYKKTFRVDFESYVCYLKLFGFSLLISSVADNIVQKNCSSQNHFIADDEVIAGDRLTYLDSMARKLQQIDENLETLG
jgi:hypothetical protein